MTIRRTATSRRKSSARRALVARVLQRVCSRSVALVLIVGMNWVGITAVGHSVAAFTDTETSPDNFISATEFDFIALTENTVFGVGAGELVHRVIHLEGTTTDQTYLSFRAESLVPENCDGLSVVLSFGGEELYSGTLIDLSAATTTGNIREISVDELHIDISETTEEPAYGTSCDWNLVFDGTQFPTLENDGGFSDTETQNWSVAFRKQIVLNEFLPNPDGVAYGFDFGKDSDDMPQGEWIEMYNNGDSPADLSEWYVWDASEGEGNKVFITSANTVPSGTIIGAHSWLVVYLNKAILNNTGDTVRLFDADDRLVDEHTYTLADNCEHEPTPGGENATEVSGACSSVPPNKSYARIPDGTGAWVDPVPTPGGANTDAESLPADAVVENISNMETGTATETPPETGESATVSEESSSVVATDDNSIPVVNEEPRGDAVPVSVAEEPEKPPTPILETEQAGQTEEGGVVISDGGTEGVLGASDGAQGMPEMKDDETASTIAPSADAPPSAEPQ